MDNRCFPTDGMVAMVDVMNFLHVSKSSIRRMMARGELIARKIGQRTIRFDAQRVREYAGVTKIRKEQ